MAINRQNQYTGTTTGATFGYDANGNLTSSANAPHSTTYAYDVENRLVSATGTHNATLAYDPLGRLFEISSPTTGLTQFLYDGDELVAEYVGWGNFARRYVHGDDSDDPQYWFEGAGLDQPRFPHVNHQGSITAVAGPSATPLWINSYDEYGMPGAGNQGRFGYTGQTWIPELGLWHYKARFYSPTLGRFLQVDPIGYEDQVNLYAYVENDPVNSVDPNGAQTVPIGSCMGCHSSPRPTLSPQVPRLPTRSSPKPEERSWLDRLGTTICQNSWICSAVAYEDAPEVDNTGKVHGDLPDANDIHPDDYDDAIEALDQSIDTRARENERFPDGKKNGTPEERGEFQRKQQHRERQHDEQRLRDRLAKKRDDYK